MAYNLKYYHQYNDRGDHVNRVEILGKDFSGSSELIIKSTGDPIITRHSGSKNEKKIILGKELQFAFFCFPEDVDKYDELFESDYKDYKIRFYKDSSLEFEGWLMPENLSREFFKDQYIINLSATDGLAKLKNVEFLDSDDSIVEGVISILNVLKYALAKLELELDFRIQLGTYESALMVSNECALDKMSIDVRRFVSGNKPMFCTQVIEYCLKIFSCILQQKNGYYQITNKHEGDSYEFVFDWSTLTQQNRTAANKIADLEGYFYESAVLSKIHPLKYFGITFRNRDLGEDATGLDLTDWDNDWTITFDNHGVTGNTVVLWSGINYPGDYIEPDTDFNVPYVFPYNSIDYFTISFDYMIETIVSSRPNPIILISIKRPDSTYSDPLFIYPQLDNWRTFDSKIHPRLKILSSGNHNIRITFDHDEDTDPGNYNFYIKNVNISLVKSPGSDVDADTDADVSRDEYYRQTTGKNLELLEDESKLADADKTSEIGALLHNGTTLTTSWNTYGNTEGIKIIDIWARNELNNRYSYKNYLRVIVHDIESNIDMDSILSINGSYYTFISYHRNHKKCIVTGDLEELLLSHQSYSNIQYHSIESSDGDNTDASSAGTDNIGIHNQLIGLQGGIPADDELYHFTEAEHTELHAWLDNVVLSDAGGIDMDDVLKADTINEHTTDAGITFEGIKAIDNYLEFLEISTPAAPDATHGRLFVDTADGLIKFRNNSATYDLTASGGAPAAHATSHENNGSDEISVTGLSGLLADGQTPLSHTHGNITNAGAIGAAANLPIITTTSGVLTTSTFGTGANTFCEGDDSRLSDSRTPTVHAASHESGGSDEISLTGLAGLLQDAQTPLSHAANHQNGGGDEISVTGLSGLLGDAQTPLSHDLISAYHTASGLTAGHFLQALTPTTFGFVAHGLTHDGFADFVANEHINHTSVSISTTSTSGLNGGGTIAATRSLTLDLSRLTAVTTIADGDMIGVYVGGTGQRRISWSNTKNELQNELLHDSFSDFVSAEHINWSITGGENIHTDRIQVAAVTQHEGSINHNNLTNTHNLTTDINHDSLTGFVAAEHYNHGSISVTAGTGLTGGGTIAATRTINLNVSSLTNITTLAGADEFAVYDSGVGQRCITYTALLTNLENDLTIGGIDMSGGANNRVTTAIDADSIQAEANLTFNGSTLTLSSTVVELRSSVSSNIAMFYNLGANGTYYLFGDNTIEASAFTSAIAIQIGNPGASSDSIANLNLVGYQDTVGQTLGHIWFQQAYGTVADTYNRIAQIAVQTGSATNDGNLRIMVADGGSLEDSVYCYGGGGVELYYAGTKHLETDSAGINIAGILGITESTAQTATVNTVLNLTLESTGSAVAGFGPALVFYYSDTSYSDIQMGNIEYAKTDAGQYGTYMKIWVRSGVHVPTEGMMIDEDGKVYMKNLANEAGDYFVKYEDSASEGELTYDSSDEKFKTNIEKWEFDSLSFLNSLDIKTYDRLDYSKKKGQIGWIAQDVKSLIPGMVGESRSGKLLIKEPRFLHHFHQGINQLSEKFETYEQKINRMERHIIQLENKIKKYENKINRT